MHAKNPKYNNPLYIILRTVSVVVCFLQTSNVEGVDGEAELPSIVAM